MVLNVQTALNQKCDLDKDGVPAGERRLPPSRVRTESARRTDGDGSTGTPWDVSPQVRKGLSQKPQVRDRPVFGLLIRRLWVRVPPPEPLTSGNVTLPATPDGTVARVSGTLQRIDGELQPVEPKTDRGRRTAALPRGLVEALGVRRREQTTHRTGNGWGDDCRLRSNATGRPTICA
jgi:hypothetical protein